MPESSGRDSATFRWSVERRLAFIEDRLFWLGEINRTDLVRRFGVSLGQASADIARYLESGPPDVHYDKNAKRYVAGAKFEPTMGPADASRFLGELRLLDAGLLAANDALFDVAPPFDVAPVPERRVDPFVLRTVLGAIRRLSSVDLLYQSMTRVEPMQRTIEPHALAYDGFRWHTRAFDPENGRFGDFVLGRISNARINSPARSRSKDDLDWHTFVDLKIAPHPALTRSQAKAIGVDYGIRGKSAVVRIRRALLFYALRRLGLDVSPEARRPQEQHIVLLNRADVMASAGASTET